MCHYKRGIVTCLMVSIVITYVALCGVIRPVCDDCDNYLRIREILCIRSTGVDVCIALNLWRNWLYHAYLVSPVFQLWFALPTSTLQCIILLCSLACFRVYQPVVSLLLYPFWQPCTCCSYWYKNLRGGGLGSVLKQLSRCSPAFLY